MRLSLCCCRFPAAGVDVSDKTDTMFGLSLGPEMFASNLVDWFHYREGKKTRLSENCLVYRPDLPFLKAIKKGFIRPYSIKSAVIGTITVVIWLKITAGIVEAGRISKTGWSPVYNSPHLYKYSSKLSHITRIFRALWSDDFVRVSCPCVELLCFSDFFLFHLMAAKKNGGGPVHLSTWRV